MKHNMENDNTGQKDWLACKNILCIRADNMGDLLMSTPAIAALKNTINCKITVLTSKKAAGIARLIPEIDEVIIADLPWVKPDADPGAESLQELGEFLKIQAFDGCVIFSVYSQHTLPSALIAYLAGIPLRLSYCRENPYHLLTHWVPDQEPYFYINHQVERDLHLVRTLGAATSDRTLRLKLNPEIWEITKIKAIRLGVDLSKPYLILHPGVSEQKREYPEELWVAAGKLIAAELRIQLLITGTEEEEMLCLRISAGIGAAARCVSGTFDLEEYASLIKYAQTVVSVNTVTIHLAAAVNKPLVVLYAQTNPQHTPWMVHHKLLEYSVPEEKRSHNQVIRYVNDQYYSCHIPYPSAAAVFAAVKEILKPEK